MAPLQERDANISGRSSRASLASLGSRGQHRSCGGGGGGGGNSKSDLLSSAPGVMSMLRTSTELGDIGGLTGDSSALTNMPRAPPRRGASSRLSTGSSQSNKSNRTSRHQARLSTASIGARHSLTRESYVPQYVPDTLSPTVMNLPGSSPLIPRVREGTRDSREGHRSLSMTNTSQPTFRLSGNRSFASLRTNEPIQRPKSPYHYPTRLRRPGYRPSSPASSDYASTNNGRSHRHGSQGQVSYPGQLKRRTPSEHSMRREERAPGTSRPPSRGPPARYIAGAQADIPPVPPVPPLIHHRIAAENGREAHKPAKASISSGSTNQRTDSDIPSSDDPSPPTPKDGTSMEVLINPTDSRVLMDTITGMIKEEMTSGPLYYDYSEQFENVELEEPGEEPVPPGFVHRIKTILEERGSNDGSPKKADASVGKEVVEPSVRNSPDAAELPASPVARRITRDLILAALEPGSTTDNIVDTSGEDTGRKSQDSKMGNPMEKQETIGPGPEQVTTPSSQPSKHGDDHQGVASPDESLPQPGQHKDHRWSILSQADTSIMDSSTLNFAVQYSIPIVTGTVVDSMEEQLETESAAGSQSKSFPAGEGCQVFESYQGGENKQEEDDSDDENEGTSDDLFDRRSNHAAKPSDEQSFKSCTDLPDQTQDTKTSKSYPDLPEPAFKDSDARSFKTCKDTVTPDRAMYLAQSRLPSTNLAPPELVAKKSPPALASRHARVSTPDSGLSKSTTRFRANSKVSSKHGSAAASVSSVGASSLKQPPTVPPRDSSSSKEAQRSQAVADFLLRRLGPKQLPQAHSSTDHKEGSGEGAVQQPMNHKTGPPEQQQSAQGLKSLEMEKDAPHTPENKSLINQRVAMEKRIADEVKSHAKNSPNQLSSPKEFSHGARMGSPIVHKHSSSTPPPVITETSSVYSPDNLSLEKSHGISPLEALTKPAESCRRDSQTTTHLVWHGRRSMNLPSTSFVEQRINQSQGQDETTTDLRLSAYRYPLNCLPDLKEESHEDSSLNTSASNVRNSAFKFPIGSQATMRASIDDLGVLARNPSTKSYRGSSLAQSRGLPSMNFSQMDLSLKLNEALDMRSFHSSDDAPTRDGRGGLRPALRPTSTKEIREKYRSFMASLDELDRTGDPTQVATVLDLVPGRQSWCPDALMAELDKLTIPSVGGLTQRLSELIPSLREYYRRGELAEFIEEEEIMEHALEEINEVGGPVVPKRSSARLRAMPGSPNMVVIEDDLYEELTGREKDWTTFSSGGTGQQGRSKSIRRKAAAHVRTPLAELEAPSPALMRTRSLAVGPHELRTSLESRLSSRSHRSAVSTPTATTDTRPWNSDKNYPWASNNNPVDISFPTPSRIRSSPCPRPSLLRYRLSDSSTIDTFSPATASTLSPDATSASAHQQVHSQSQSRRFSVFTSKSHPAGERYPTSALTPPDNIIAESHTAFSDTSSEETRAIPSRKTTFKLFTRRSGAGNDRTLEDHPVTPYNTSAVIAEDLNDDSREHDITNSNNLDNGNSAANMRRHRHTFQGATGMPRARYHCMKLSDVFKVYWDKLRALFHKAHREKDASSRPMTQVAAFERRDSAAGV